MHMQLLNNDHVIIFDRITINSNLTFKTQECSHDWNPNNPNCMAYSLDYDPISKTFHPLTILTNTLSSSGATLPNGTRAVTNELGALYE